MRRPVLAERDPVEDGEAAADEGSPAMNDSAR